MRKMADLVRDQNPVMCPPTTSVKKAAKLMRERAVGAVLVAEDNARLVGIFTGRDAIARVLAEGRDPARTMLAEVMTADPETMTPRDNAIEALRLMQDVHCRHVPIVHEGRVVGIVSRGDFRGSEKGRLDEETGLWERIAY
jgi:CBS domain-containing protein